MEIRTRRKREGDLGAAGSGSGRSSQRLWMSLNEEQEKLSDRIAGRAGEGGGVVRDRLGDLSHGGHMSDRVERKMKVKRG